MKKIFSAIFTASALVGSIGLYSCDDIAENDRIIELSKDSINFTADTTVMLINNEEFTFINEHRMLFEDYTGDLCVNCPNLSTALHGLIENNHYASVVVEVHPKYGNLATGTYCTDEANTYATQFGPLAGLPCLSIDRKPMSTGILNTNPINLFDSEIKSVTSTIFSEYAKIYTDGTEGAVNLAINVKDNDDKTFDIQTAVLSDVTLDNAKLQLWVTEDSLISVQAMLGAYDMKYAHNHTLRGAINGTWGESISVVADEPTIASHTVSFEGKTWVAANSHVVAFVYNADTYEVLNAIEVSLK